MKKLAVMQPYIFPYIGYFQLVNAVDKFVFYDDVNYIARGWVNRNNILINGEANMFSIPLHKASQNALINEVRVKDDHRWRKKFLKKIELAYKKAPFYKSVYEIVACIMDEGFDSLSELAKESIKEISGYLKIDIVFDSSLNKYDNKLLKGQERILDICKQENATHYINPIGGSSLYSKELFSRHGIELSFIKTGDVTYEQYGNTFVPSLSIIDVMMFNSPEQIRYFLNDFELI